MRIKRLFIHIVVILIVSVKSQNLVRIENGVDVAPKGQESNLGASLTSLIKKVSVRMGKRDLHFD